ncbi:hypothetical protein [Nonomuraea maritima]|uniref:SbtR family transcriptional regulator n=1 Tax=Nonomuraea maritima TaxID=683260 RepID=UPI003CCBAB6F
MAPGGRGVLDDDPWPGGVDPAHTAGSERGPQHDAHRGGRALRRRAVDVGAVRPDVAMADLLTLVNAISLAAQDTGADEAERLITLALEGIRPRTAAPARPPGCIPHSACPRTRPTPCRPQAVLSRSRGRGLV